MSQQSRRLVLLAVCAAALIPAAAQAQWYGAPPQQPASAWQYGLQPGQPYVVEVAPGKYVIHRPTRRRVARKRARAHHVDRTSHTVGRLRYGGNVASPERREASSAHSPFLASGRGDHHPRVIHADAEVTILGPDRMSIRLIRKRAAGVHDEAKAKRSPKQ